MKSLFTKESNLNDQWVWLVLFVLVSVNFYVYYYSTRVLFSQSGYGQSKWESRTKNANKARDKKNRVEREKAALKAENEKKALLHKRQAKKPLNSQASPPINFPKESFWKLLHSFEEKWSDFRTFFVWSNLTKFVVMPQMMPSTQFHDLWMKLSDIASEFKVTLPELDIPEIDINVFGKYWNLFKDSEIFSQFYHILRLCITLGFMKKIDISFKGNSLFVSEPLRDRVTFTQLLENVVEFFRMLYSKLYAVYETGNIELFFASETKNAYDDEYSFLKSQKVLIDLGRKAEVDDETYDRRVHECIQQTLTYLNTCKAGERSYYSPKLVVLRDLQASRMLSKKEGIREKPYGVLLFGESGVGKSAIANAVVRFILQVNGKDFSPRAVTSLNTEDKFQSEFMTHHKGVIFDDICNTALDRTDGSPATPIIMFLNNMTMAALNPNAEMKGKVMIEPDVVCATTNVKDLMSNQLSNEPLSINRRFECTITQTVRPEYRKTGSTMLDNNKITHMSDTQFPDYGLYSVEEPYYAPDSTGNKTKTGRQKAIAWRYRTYKGKPLEDVSIVTLLQFLREDSREHFAKQEAFVEGQKKLTSMPLCEHSMPVGCCPDCPLDSQVSLPYVNAVGEYLYSLEGKCVDWASQFVDTLLRSQYGHALIAYFMRDVLKSIFYDSVGYYVCIIGTIFTLDIVGVDHGAIWVTLITLLYLSYVCFRFYLVRYEAIRKLTNIPRPSDLIKDMTWASKMKVVYFLVSIGVWKVLVALARRWKTLPTVQAAGPITLTPDMKPYQQETEFWDVRAREAAYKFGNAGASDKSKTISIDKFVPLVGNRMMQATKPDGSYCNAIPLRSNVLLVPNHFVPKSTEFITLTKVGGHTFKNMPLDRDVVQRIPGTDFAVWYCSGSGLHRDLVDYHPKEILEGKKLDVFTLYNNNGKLVKFPNMTACRGRVLTTQGGTFSGFNYSFPESTFGGLCMAMLVGNANGIPFIAGYHLAGRGSTGAAGFVTRSMIEDTIKILEKKPGVLISHSAMPLETEIMGVEFGPCTKPHEKCVTNDLNSDAKIRIHGAHNQPRSDPRSAVVTSLISTAVVGTMGIVKQHGPPKEMGNRKHKELDIAGKVDTATKFDSTLFQKACVDYSARLESLPKRELAKLGKISDDVNLSGLDGVLGVNAMNFATSVGFPGKGPKNQVVEKSDRVVPGISCPRDVDPIILEEIAKLEQTLLRGESINTVFKGSLKDEPTKLTKDKVRVFAAANMPFVMLVRKYYLTLAACFQRNKQLTECAVGTVVQSPEWTELYEHIGKFGWDRAVAGDYAKFDGRMSPQFMLAAFKILIELAEKSGNYDADDLTIMRGIATEISYPTYDYFGTILQFMGSNPSGHPMTVIINSIVNSLYMRYTYYAIAKSKGWWKVPAFDQVVALMTYGDDNIMTVKEGYDDFNHTAIMQEFEKVGIQYTMADKEAESVPFISLNDASFLKHFAVWDDELELYRSPVEDASIAKMLHTHLRSKVLTMEQSSAEAIQNVALKYFEFGREVYTERIAQLEEVARLAGIQGYIGPIPSYDERVQWYREKFDL